MRFEFFIIKDYLQSEFLLFINIIEVGNQELKIEITLQVIYGAKI